MTENAMNPGKLINSLERFGRMLPEVVRDLVDEDARWKPADGAWSVLEVVCHLADEEEFDFPLRLKMTLADPARQWPPIDPEGWAVERQYNEADLGQAVARFVSLRKQSIAWLRMLDHPDWNQAHEHPQFDPFPAGDMLAAWTAHDWLHLRQISKRLYQLAGRDAGTFSTRYAGEWDA